MEEHYPHLQISISDREGVTPSVSRLSTNQPTQVDTRALANGLWTCQLNGSVIGAVPLGIYARGGGEQSYTTLYVVL